MKIGYVLKKFPRLSETFILNEILGLESMGHDVVVFSLRKPDEEPLHDGLKNLKAQIILVSTKTDPAIKNIEPSAIEYAEGLVPARRKKSLVQGLRIAALCQDLGIDHLHAHFMTVASHVASIARLSGGPTFSVTAHAKDIFRTGVDGDVFRRTYGHAATLITVSQFNRDFIARQFLGGRENSIQVIYNGLPLDDLQVRTSTSPRREGSILAVGRLVEKKGFDTLLLACKKLLSEGREFHLSIVGKGDEEKRLKTMTTDLGLEDSVHFVGATPRENVVELMHKSAIFVLPCRRGSDGNSDALPTVLLEALACGLPSISTQFVGIPEIIIDEHCGILVPPNNAEATATAILRLLDDPALRAEYARNGIRRVAQTFNRDKTIRELIGVFEASIECVDANGESP